MVKKRLLLKVSGASFKGSDNFIDFQFAKEIVKQVVFLAQEGYEIVLIVGGGNICRGRDFIKIFPKSQVPLDHIGMLSTVINGLFLKEVFKSEGLDPSLMSSLNVDARITYGYNWYHANKLLKKHKVLILTGGIGNPNFSTDFSALLNAKQLNVKLILFGKNNINGIYSADPKLYPNSHFIDKISFNQVVAKKLEFIDISAAAFNMNAKIDLLVFDIKQPNAIINVLKGEGKYTIVTNS